MGNNEEAKSSKSEKSSSPVPPDQTNIHVYPDWAAMQAYYGPRVALPPYYNSAVASGHAPPPYMWGPAQPMMPPYGPPYAAMYSHGGVYGHPAVPVGPHSNGHAVPISPAAVTPSSIETPTKSSGNSDKGLMKKLKGFDGLAMAIGNGTADPEAGAAQRLSSSAETEGSSDGSDGNTAGNETRKKRSREGTPTTGENGSTENEARAPAAGQVNGSPGKVPAATVASSKVVPKSLGNVLSPGMATSLELKNLPLVNAKASPTSVPQTSAALPSEVWLQNERELKRERRKQSNRESARRSRLRKQVEAEELGHKVESLTAENVALKSEINQLNEKSQKMRVENAALMEKLKNVQLGHTKDILNQFDDQRTPPVSTENLLSRVNNSGPVDRASGEASDPYESKSGTKLRQLLDTSPRADAVAAG